MCKEKKIRTIQIKSWQAQLSMAARNCQRAAQAGKLWEAKDHAENVITAAENLIEFPTYEREQSK